MCWRRSLNGPEEFDDLMHNDSLGGSRMYRSDGSILASGIAGVLIGLAVS